MSQLHGADAEIISMEEQRQARAARQAPATRPRRPRCAAETGTGRRCRNYAVTDGYCRVHADEAATAPAREPSGSGAAHPAEPGDAAAGPAGWTAPGPSAVGGATGPSAGATGADSSYRERLEQVAASQGLSDAVDAIGALREVAGDRWLDHLKDAADFAQRRLTGDYEIDDFGFDQDLTSSVLMPLLRPLHRYYWRVSSHGAEHLPRTSGGLVVANHAGTLPADALITRLDILEQTDRHARELAADLVFRLPVVGELARKTGATLASNDDADRLLERGELVAVWPEGFKGVGKRWKDRYKLQRFGRGGFVATALRAQVPIVPTAIVGSEEIYPMVYDLRIVARALGLPYFPVVAQMFALPVLGPLALLPLPSKWIIEYGEPIDTTAYGPEAANDPMAVFDLTDRIRETIQDMLHRNLMGRRSVFL
jgi:1-acyl-sn-glycerol-3-phosphate acyltransferase